MVAGDPDPLVNTVTATYTSGVGIGHGDGQCQHEPVRARCRHQGLHARSRRRRWDGDLHHRRHQHELGGRPALGNGTIVDTLTGNLLDAANTAVTSSDCTPVLATGASCTIVTARTVLATDPNLLVNTVTVTYNPAGFPNVITANASDSVVVNQPPGGEGCTPGFWKQEQHFDSWVGFAPSDSFEAVFGVDVTLRAGGQNTIEDPTLLDALNANGGGVNALARHAVAALLNASNPDAAPPTSPSQK